MTYAIKEIFYSLQGEGANVGRPAVFCRFSGCNLWTGREEDRKAARCSFCDTDFVGVDGTAGGRFGSAEQLAEAIARVWSGGQPNPNPFVICTGGEPLLQLDQELVDALHACGMEVAVETNGTVAPAPKIDWVCVSPKGRNPVRLDHGDELKLVFPQPDARPEQFEGLRFRHFFLQPMDGPNVTENTRKALQYCLDHPRWRLSLQTHKLLDIR